MSGATTVQGVSLQSFVGAVSPQVFTTPYTAIGNTARSLLTRAQEVVNVKDFGAPGSAGGDSAPGINAAFTYVRGLGASVTARVVFPADTYTLLSPINATGLQSPGIIVDGCGSTLQAAFSGGIVFDFFDTRYLKLRDLFITWDGTHEPAVGLAGGSIGTRVADCHTIENVFIEGNFSLACAYFIATETSAARSLRCWNGDGSATSYALIVDGTNHFGVSSSFAPQTSPSDTFTSFNEMLFDQVDARKPNGGHAIWIGGVSRHSWQASYVDCQTATQAVVLWASAGNTNQSITDLMLDLHQETMSCTDVFLVDGPNATPTIQGLSYRDHRPQASSSIFRTATQIAGVTAQNLTVDIAQLAQAPVLFANPTLWTVSGSLISPTSATLLNAVPAQFSGTQLTPLGIDGSALHVAAGSNTAPLATRFGHVADIVADYGADPTGVVDATIAIQAAVNSGRPVWMPVGTFLLGGAITIPSTGARIYGAGMGVTVLNWQCNVSAFTNNGPMNGQLQPSYVEMSGFTIAGNFTTNPNSAFNNPATADSNVVAVSIFGMERVRLFHVELTNAPYFGFSIHACKIVDIESCMASMVCRDCFSCVDSAWVSIRGCRVDHCDDDAITAGVNVPPASWFADSQQNFICIGNHLTDTYCIRVDNRKQFTVAGNIIDRAKSHAISIGAITPGATGGFGTVTGNTVSNVINEAAIPGISPEDGDSQCNYIEVFGNAANGALNAPPGQNDPTTGTVMPLYTHLYDTTANAPSAGSLGVLVSGNVFARTRPTGVAYTSWGEGAMFTRRGWFSGNVPASAMSGYGAILAGSVEDVTLSDNKFRGLTAGVVLGNLPGVTARFQGVRIRGCSFSDIATAAAIGIGGFSGIADVIVADCTFDLDPYRTSAQRTAAGAATWGGTGGYPVLWAGNGMSITLRNCTLRNAYSYTDGSPVSGEGNTIFANVVGLGATAGNAGVGFIPQAGTTWRFVELNQSVTSASFDNLLQLATLDALAQPASGTWVQGHHVHNTGPALAGGMLTLGWTRLTTGAGNVAGTDWAQVLTMGGTVAVRAQQNLAALNNTAAMTITAAEIVAGYSIRTGQAAAVTDTLDTASDVVAAITNCAVGTTFKYRSLNAGGFTQTVAPGAGITASGTMTVAANTWREWMGVVTSVSPPAITFTNIGSGAA
jgi:hypothetical protein